MLKEHLSFEPQKSNGCVTGGCWHKLMCSYCKRHTHLFKNIPNPLEAISILTLNFRFSQ